MADAGGVIRAAQLAQAHRSVEKPSDGARDEKPEVEQDTAYAEARQNCHWPAVVAASWPVMCELSGPFLGDDSSNLPCRAASRIFSSVSSMISSSTGGTGGAFGIHLQYCLFPPGL